MMATTRTKPDVGLGRELAVHLEELLGPRRRDGEVGADERAARVVLEPPAVRVEGRGTQLVGEPVLLVGPEDERERIRRAVSEAGVDEPFRPIRQPRRDPEVIAVRAGSVRPAALNARDMSRDVDLEPLEQGDQSTVEVEAVAAAAGDDPVDARERLDSRGLTAVDVDVLVGDPGDMSSRDRRERRGVHLASRGVDAEMLEVRRRGAIR